MYNPREHYVLQDITGWLWKKTPERFRWKFVGWLHDRDPEKRDWCQLVDCALLMSSDDYSCGCEVTVPWRVGPPRYGFCYCVPSELREKR